VTELWFLMLCAAGMVLAQDVYPGQAIYHYGWYNAVNVGLIVIAALQVRRLHSRGAAVAAFGAAIIVLAGVASGLMGPDTQLVVIPGAGHLSNTEAAARFNSEIRDFLGSLESRRWRPPKRSDGTSNT